MPPRARRGAAATDVELELRDGTSASIGSIVVLNRLYGGQNAAWLLRPQCGEVAGLRLRSYAHFGGVSRKMG